PATRPPATCRSCGLTPGPGCTWCGPPRTRAGRRPCWRSWRARRPRTRTICGCTRWTRGTGCTWRTRRGCWRSWLDGRPQRPAAAAQQQLQSPRRCHLAP
ncbi:unnamed protein product, partial [Heterosigma akashiwo]